MNTTTQHPTTPVAQASQEAQQQARAGWSRQRAVRRAALAAGTETDAPACGSCGASGAAWWHAELRGEAEHLSFGICSACEATRDKGLLGAVFLPAFERVNAYCEAHGVRPLVFRDGAMMYPGKGREVPPLADECR